MRDVMNTAAVAEHFACTPRKAREIMKAVGLIKVGHGYIYRDALERYEAVMTDHTAFTLPILQQDFPTKHPRYQRERRTER